MSRIHFDSEEFSGIDSNHVYDAFIKYEFAIDFKYIEAENVSFQVVKNVFSVIADVFVIFYVQSYNIFN